MDSSGHAGRHYETERDDLLVLYLKSTRYGLIHLGI